MLLTNLGNDRIICLQPLSQLAIELDYLHVNLKEPDPLYLDCGNEQHRQALQRLINQDIYQGAWQWVIDKKPGWLAAIAKVRHHYYEPGKARSSDRRV